MKKKEVLDGGRVEGTSTTYKDYLKQKFDAVQEVRNQKRALYDDFNKIKDKLEKLESER